MKMNEYIIFTEGVKLASNSLVYTFSNTRNIELTVKCNGFCLRVRRSIKKRFDEILSDKLYRDAIKKSYLIQLIKYGKVKHKSVYVSINGEVKKIYDCSTGPFVFCLCGEKLIAKMSAEWGENQFRRILSVTKSKENRLDAALYALVIAKSKIYVVEKFIYLWMAMNGLYGYVAKKAEECIDDNSMKKWIKREYAQLKFFALFYSYDYKTLGKDSEDLFRRKLEFELSKEYKDISIQFKESDKKKIYEIVSKSLNEFNLIDEMSVEATMILYFPYLLRCKYFHSEKALPLLCFENEHPLPVINVVNILIEEFLDKNVHRWMNVEEIYTLENRIKCLATSCKCNNKGRLISYQEVQGGNISDNI